MTRIERLHLMPCIICRTYNLPQMSPTQAHHCIHERFSTTKRPDEMTIPLCEGHHQGLFDVTKVALHRQPAMWKSAYGLDTDWLKLADQWIKEEEENTI